MLQSKVDFKLFTLFWQTRESTQDLLKPTDAINVEDGGSKVSGSVNALHKAGVELNNPELKENSQQPVWKAKQQLLGLLKVCYRSYGRLECLISSQNTDRESAGFQLVQEARVIYFIQSDQGCFTQCTYTPYSKMVAILVFFCLLANYSPCWNFGIRCVI